MSELNDLMLQAERLEAAQACRNLMGRYSYLHSAFRNKEFMELWSKRDDVSQTMPFGKFIGYEGCLLYTSYREGVTRIDQFNRLELSNITQAAAPTVNNGVLVRLDRYSSWLEMCIRDRATMSSSSRELHT